LRGGRGGTAAARGEPLPEPDRCAALLGLAHLGSDRPALGALSFPRELLLLLRLALVFAAPALEPVIPAWTHRLLRCDVERPNVRGRSERSSMSRSSSRRRPLATASEMLPNVVRDSSMTSP